MPLGGAISHVSPRMTTIRPGRHLWCCVGLLLSNPLAHTRAPAHDGIDGDRGGRVIRVAVWSRVEHFLKFGVLGDVETLKKACQANFGDITFQEA